MPPHMMGMSGESETSLLSILLNVAFGFVAGLMFFLGVFEVLEYGKELAADILEAVGYGQMPGMNIASFAPYIILAPLGGMVLKQLSSVRSLKSFAFFAVAVIAGVAIAFVTQGYFAAQIG
jgi:hypothetical protein